MKSARRLVKRDPVHVAPIAIKQATIATRTGQFRGAACASAVRSAISKASGDTRPPRRGRGS